jgi:hypothetical protein
VLVASCGGPQTASTIRSRGRDATAEICANANLIAAAPDLLAACQRVLRAIEWAQPEDRMTAKEQAETLRDAIAKATA